MTAACLPLGTSLGDWPSCSNDRSVLRSQNYHRYTSLNSTSFSLHQILTTPDLHHIRFSFDRVLIPQGSATPDSHRTGSSLLGPYTLPGSNSARSSLHQVVAHQVLTPPPEPNLHVLDVTKVLLQSVSGSHPFFSLFSVFSMFAFLRELGKQITVAQTRNPLPSLVPPVERLTFLSTCHHSFWVSSCILFSSKPSSTLEVLALVALPNAHCCERR